MVIGGGPAGLKAAHVLAKGGLGVTLLEHSRLLGGLAGSFDVQGVRIERYYHFICQGDDDLVATLDELGLAGPAALEELAHGLLRGRPPLPLPHPARAAALPRPSPSWTVCARGWR